MALRSSGLTPRAKRARGRRRSGEPGLRVASLPRGTGEWHAGNHTPRLRYFMDLAPGVVSALLDWCYVSAVVEPQAARFGADRVPPGGYLDTGVMSAERDVWFLPDVPVQLLVRRADPGSNLPLASAPPAPIREPRRTVTLVRPHACPHCGHRALSFRNLVGAWLCDACARSFSVGPTELADVIEDEETAAGSGLEQTPRSP